MSPLPPDRIPLLRRAAFFSSFTEEELARLAERMKLLSLPKGAALFRQSDEGDALYVISSGRLRLVHPDTEKTAAYVGRGETLGEMALLTGESRPHTAEADSAVELLVLYRTDFEELLRETPTMAVQISRVLSRRLLETTRRTAATPLPSKIFPLVARLPAAESVLFAVNLAISLTEQTRRKVLLLDVLDRDEGLFARALGLTPVRVGEMSLRQADLLSPEVVEKLAVHHPSGLELMSLPLSLMDGKLFGALYPFLGLLRKHYDFTLIALPSALSPAVRTVLEEGDRVLYVDREPPAAEEAAFLDALGTALPAEKIHRVRLAEGAAPAVGPAIRLRLPWRAAAAREALERRAPFLGPEDRAAQRLLDRLARELAGLRVGFAMGSGAALGYAMIGMLRVLEKNGIYPDVISGTSMGALIGSFYAAGKSPDELTEIARGITKQKLISLADVTLPWQGVILGRRVLAFLRSILGESTFDQLSIPFACVATDILTGEEVLLKEGRVAEAVRGSLSLPFFFQPFFHQGRFLVDGGLVNPVPTSVLASLGADILISVNLTPPPTNKAFLRGHSRRRHSSAYWKGPNIIQVMLKTLYTMQFRISQARAEISHVTMAPDLSDFAWAEFHRADEIIRIGETCAEESLPKIKSLLPFYSDYCRVPLQRPGYRNY